MKLPGGQHEGELVPEYDKEEITQAIDMSLDEEAGFHLLKPTKN